VKGAPITDIETAEDFTIGKISAINSISSLSKSEAVSLRESAFAHAKYIMERGLRNVYRQKILHLYFARRRFPAAA
jgi:hypothetical protein